MRETGVILNNLEEYSRCMLPQLDVKGRLKETKSRQEAREKRDMDRNQENSILIINLK